MKQSGDLVQGPWRYEEIAGASHWIPLDAPDQLNGLLLDWLSPQVLRSLWACIPSLHAVCSSRRQNRKPPRTAPSAPRPVMTAALSQSGAEAGAGTKWKKTDVSKSQWLVWTIPPANSMRNDQAR